MPGEVKIAIVDSGVNAWHSHVGKVETGVGLSPAPANGVISHPDFSDSLGHGTAVAGVIRGILPEALLFPVKIFHRDLNAPIGLLSAALRWAIDHDMKVIHLSLGTAREENRPSLAALCREADTRRMVVVAAARSAHDRIFPAVFDSVIGAFWHRSCRPGEIIHLAGSPVAFGACGRPRPIPGVPEALNYSGASFAAAHVTALTGLYLSRHPDADAREVRQALISESTRSRLNERFQDQTQAAG